MSKKIIKLKDRSGNDLFPIPPSNYAKNDGYYTGMTVGRSENLIDTKGGGSLQLIYNRTAAGNVSIVDVGTGNIQSIWGRTVNINQKAPNVASGSWNANRSTVDYEAATKRVTVTDARSSSNSSYGSYRSVSQAYTLKGGHKLYAVIFNIDTSGEPDLNRVSMRFAKTGSVNVSEAVNYSGGRDFEGIYTLTDDATIYTMFIYTTTTRTASGGYVSFDGQICIVDLTQMYGEGSEPVSINDERIAWLKAYLYENKSSKTGELISFSAEGIRTVGFNQMNSEGKASVISGKEYEVFGSATSITYSDETEIQLSSGKFTADRTGIITVEGYDENTCVHLVWGGYRDGETESYWKQERELPIQTYFPDRMRSSGMVFDELQNNKSIKRIGAVNLGALTWTRSANGYFYSPKIADIAVVANSRTKPNVTCSIYEPSTATAIYADRDTDLLDMVVGMSANGNIHDGELWVKNSAYSDSESFKTAMNGVMLLYELADPIVSEIDPPLNLSYKVADFGTEEVYGGDLPMEAVIKYSDDFTRQIANLPQTYQSQDSMDNFMNAVGAAIGGTFSKSWDAESGRYAYTFTPGGDE